MPVSSDHLAISPQIDVVLFTTSTHLMLCRRSGQQVWSTRLPLVEGKSDTVTSIAWSPDGDLCAVVMGSGSVVTYDVSSGRSVAQNHMKKISNISSIAWSPQSSRESIDKAVEFIVGEFSPATELGNESTFAAFGTRDGNLKVSMFGALDIDEIPLNNNDQTGVYLVAANEADGEYAAIQGTTFYIFRTALESSTRATKTCVDMESLMLKKIYEQTGLTTNQEKILTHQGALATVLADNLLAQCIKLQNTLEAIRDANLQFIKPYFSSSTVDDLTQDRPREAQMEIFRRALLSASMTGKRNSQFKQWVESQHEQGFKRWYKNQSQSWDTLYRIATQDLLPVLLRFIVIWRLLELDSDATYRLHILINDVILAIVPRRELFELQAGYLEYVFRDEIDRPIAVTKMSIVPVQKVGEAVLNGELFGDLDASSGISTHQTAAEIHYQLNHAVTKIRSQIKGKIALFLKLDLGERASHLRHNPITKEFKIILESGKTTTVGASGSVSTENDISRSRSSFIGDTDDIICLDAAKSLVLPNGTAFPLEFPAISVAARREQQGIVACVLSEDCRHYQFIRVDYNSG